MTRRTNLLGLVVMLAGCSDSGPRDEFGPHATLVVINGASAAGSVNVHIDGRNSGMVEVGQLYAIGDFPTGHHDIELRLSNGGLGLSRQVNFGDNDKLTIVAFDSAGILGSANFGDSNAVVPADATKLRVAHYAGASAPIDIWRTQPDYGTPIRVQFPFNYQDVSPYLQSTPGDWQVFVSTPVVNPGDPLPDTLAMVSPIPIPDGESRTVVVVDDGSGGVVLHVLNP